MSLGLGEYADAFGSQEIDEEVLPSLTADDLTALGVTSIGHRRKLLSAIAALAENPTRPTTAQPPPAPSGARAERRQLTLMFVDLVGSTELAQALDPEDMREVILAYQQAVAREIARYDGRVAKLMGDGVLAYFGWPHAHEDDAERAVRAGLAAASAAGELNAPGGKPLAARVGIATGLVVVGDLVGEGAAQEEAVVGDTPNLAARLQALAEPGAVIIADTTQKLVAGLFATADLGERLLKGFAAPVRCRRVVGETAAESRFEARHAVLAPLVGRDRELALLLECWHRATAAEGRVVLLSGEAGIGKSRLIAALTERVAAEPHAELRFFCSAYHTNSALHPLIAHLERAAGFVSDDSADSRFDKLRALVARLQVETDEALPLLAILLSIDPGRRYQPPRLPAPTLRARMLAALIGLVEASAANKPTLVLVEDAHWIDPTTAEWLGMLVERLAGLRALLVVTARPEFEPRWKALSSVEMVLLGRLEQEHGIAIVERVAGNRKLPPDIADRILANTEGVPLFVEELTRTVLDSGLLREADGRYLAIGPLPNLAIPSTLQDSLMARLDRLSPVKETAQIGACIGRIFGHRLLAAVSGTDQARLDDALHQLEQAELVFRSGVAPEATYTFKHALVRDTAYQSLLRSRRQQIHGRIAAALEAEFAEIAEAEPETVAQHYTLAGLADQGVPWWLRAGQRAMARSANREAAAHFAKGLELAASLPASETRLRQEVSLWTAMGSALVPAKGWAAPEPLQAFSTARELAARLGDKAKLFAAVRGESGCRTISGATCAPPKFLPCSARRWVWSSPKHPAILNTCWRHTISSGASIFTSAGTSPLNRLSDMALKPTTTSGIATLPGAIPGTIPASAAGRSTRRCSAYAASLTGRSSRQGKPSLWPNATPIPLAWPRHRWPSALSISSGESPERRDTGLRKPLQCAPSSPFRCCWGRLAPSSAGRLPVWVRWTMGLARCVMGSRRWLRPAPTWGWLLIYARSRGPAANAARQARDWPFWSRRSTRSPNQAPHISCLSF
ncbi:AAA family ATPase [Mesorhizobium sp. B1-1-8]|uniref:AAA family ATPase n=1 Tax=Mesorhizobium sp. B1-1-8 TaxID=2589976 RepID=UPI001171D148|nr:AAA family ATPase [Mesorhizobium sp. B1-1-8]